jgi:hypothetical protein
MPATGGTDVEGMAHYREHATQFRQWAEDEIVAEVRAGLLDMARHYKRLASEIGARSRRP